ncbi:hypothetical protein NIES4075_24210 [Tolypothrix sp. NIES-4075]|uniref:hypothetical protein n=1 Tax=Tolypothrix sp. NIES-4075 TaxID=2005459 RepID=UPI000B5CAC66|nr:hypothetical protein [Tolypothrix sp. NIES-4075]GAX41451.1 hypothetical protein NIES4075_24210 [Tolypothrix sp. NIES-4075]
MKSLKPEMIQAMTPMFIATLGAIIGVAALFSPDINGQKSSAALSLAATAIGGAAGLAQSSKQDISVNQKGKNVEFETSASEHSDRD